MNPYIPHTAADIRKMLSVLEVTGIDKLFEDIPEEVRSDCFPTLPIGLSEYEVTQKLRSIAERNDYRGVSFLGCGCYDHIIPATVDHVISRSEFYTSYTPYQAEISQGILQAIFEFQTLMCELTGLDVSNASLYDGHTAASEAAVMALNSKRGRNTVLYSESLHPFTKAVLHTYFYGTKVILKEIKEEEGVTSIERMDEILDDSAAAVIVQSPNIYGYLEDYAGFAERIHEANALFVISANPMSLSVCKSPHEWGADIGIGDCQPLGLPMFFGGPSVGYITAREKLLRKMPGRIVGETVDRDGNRAFVLTLQAREQHIKRERATSNICSNQALAALASSVYLSVVGKEGFREAGTLNLHKSRYLYERMINELPVRPLHEKPFFNEFTLVFEQDVQTVFSAMHEKGILSGIPLKNIIPTASPNALVIAVTEKRSKEELDTYVDTMKEVLR